MSDIYTEEMVLDLREVILANFHPPTDKHGSWHIRPDQMARAVLDVAGPRIAARALRDFADNDVHFQSPARMQEDLHAKADEIEAGR
jgi:hypothetical protein